MAENFCARLVGAMTLLSVITVGAGCEDIHARKLVKEGNDLYRSGEYKAAVDKYDEAIRLKPDLPQAYINKAYACFLQFSPGANSAENNKAADCALESYKKFLSLSPDRKDVRDLLIQLWLDSGHYDEALAYFKGVLDKDPKNLDAVKTIGIINSKAGRFMEALKWYEKRAQLEPDNPENWYAAGTLIWEQLHSHLPEDPVSHQINPGAIVGPQRLALADHGIHSLEKAIQINAKYTEAYTYTNLLYRERALGHENASTDPLQAKQVQDDIAKADENMKKALELIRAQKAQKKS